MIPTAGKSKDQTTKEAMDAFGEYTKKPTTDGKPAPTLSEKVDLILNRLDSIERVLERINEQVYGNYHAHMNDNFDILFDDAKKLAEEAGYVSPALFQRKLRIGYARAANLLDMLISKNIVESRDGAKPCKYIGGNND